MDGSVVVGIRARVLVGWERVRGERSLVGYSSGRQCLCFGDCQVEPFVTYHTFWIVAFVVERAVI